MGFERLGEPVFNLFGEEVFDEVDGILNKKFGVSPFSVLDGKSGVWQNRKKQWTKLGIKSELGREAKTFSMKDWADKKIEEGKLTGKTMPDDVSIFDPVVCELCYNWFLPKDSKNILDPFAGGSVRGIVAGILGNKYVGFDLSKEQIEANKINADEVVKDATKRKHIIWLNDDSANIDRYIKDESCDLIFTCPPYFDLEVYSDKPNDLSNMTWEDFCIAYQHIISECEKKLKNNRFAIFVVGDIRDKDGFYRDFVDLTKQCFKSVGMKTYNEIILLNALTSAGIRAATPFNISRKLTKVHQNILVFYKGDPKEIRNNFESFELEDL